MAREEEEGQYNINREKLQKPLCVKRQRDERLVVVVVATKEQLAKLFRIVVCRCSIDKSDRAGKKTFVFLMDANSRIVRRRHS